MAKIRLIQMPTSQTAYTLVEVLIGVAIIAILAGISIPSFQHSVEFSSVRLVQSQFLKAIQLARREAQISGRSVGVCKNNRHHGCGGEWNDGLIIFYDTHRNGIIQTEKQIVAILQVNIHDAKMNWRGFPIYRDYLYFAPNKWSANDNGIFWYCHKDRLFPDFAIMINKSGIGRVVKPDKKGEIRDSHHQAIHCF